jgi:hypothetical protein
MCQPDILDSKSHCLIYCRIRRINVPGFLYHQENAPSPLVANLDKSVIANSCVKCNIVKLSDNCRLIRERRPRAALAHHPAEWGPFVRAPSTFGGGLA